MHIPKAIFEYLDKHRSPIPIPPLPSSYSGHLRPFAPPLLRFFPCQLVPSYSPSPHSVYIYITPPSHSSSSLSSHPPHRTTPLITLRLTPLSDSLPPNRNNNILNMSPPIHPSIPSFRVCEREGLVYVRMWTWFRRRESFLQGAETGVTWRCGGAEMWRVGEGRQEVKGEGRGWGGVITRQKRRKRAMLAGRASDDDTASKSERRRTRFTRTGETKNGEEKLHSTYFSAPLITTPRRHTFFTMAVNWRADRSVGACGVDSTGVE